MSMSIMRKLKYGEPKSTHVTLTLADRSITYPYGIFEDVLVRVYDLVFPADFVILDMIKDSKTPLILIRPFLDTSKTIIDVVMRDLILRFNNENVVFNVFEELKHHKEESQCYEIERTKGRSNRFNGNNLVRK